MNARLKLHFADSFLSLQGLHRVHMDSWRYPWHHLPNQHVPGGAKGPDGQGPSRPALPRSLKRELHICDAKCCPSSHAGGMQSDNDKDLLSTNVHQLVSSRSTRSKSGSPASPASATRPCSSQVQCSQGEQHSILADKLYLSWLACNPRKSALETETSGNKLLVLQELSTKLNESNGHCCYSMRCVILRCTSVLWSQDVHKPMNI